MQPHNRKRPTTFFFINPLNHHSPSMAKKRKAASRPKNPKSAWKNRIVGHGEEDPKTLKPHDENWKSHPAFQRRAINESLGTMGWVDEIVINKVTGNMIDGHMRWEESVKNKEPSVPVRYVELSEEEERVFLATFDAIGEYARADKNKLEELLQSTSKTPLQPNLQVIHEQMAEEIGMTVEHLQHQEETKLKKSRGGESTNRDFGDDHMRVYDGRENNTDVGTGPCAHACLYCYTGASRGAINWKGVRPKAQGEMSKAVAKAARETNLIEIGMANDPSMEPFRKPLYEALKSAMSSRVYVVIQTKNPAYFIPILEELKFPSNQITIRVSFATCVDEIADKLEPGTQPPSDRVSAMNDLARIGVDVNFRLSPLFLGHYDNIPKLAHRLRNKTSLMTCELIRINRVAQNNYFSKLNGVLSPDWTIESYFDTWGRRGADATYGDMAWYDYDPYQVRNELKRLKEIAHKNGMLFSLENYESTWSNCDLNDGEHSLDTPALRAFGVNLDSDLLTSRVKDGSIAELRCDYLRGAKPGTKEYERRLRKVILANDQQRPLIAEESQNGQKEGSP